MVKLRRLLGVCISNVDNIIVLWKGIMESPKFEEKIHFNKCSDFLDFFLPWKNDLEGYVFRGHSDRHTYQLIPSVLREDKCDEYWECSPLGKPTSELTDANVSQFMLEVAILREFYRIADRNGLYVPVVDKLRRNISDDFDWNVFFQMKSGKWLSSDFIEIAALAQHYGLPTRLLDWSMDPFIAIFFAVRSAVIKGTEIEIWCLNKSVILRQEQTADETPLKFYTPHYKNNNNIIGQKGLFTYWATEIRDIRELYSRNGEFVGKSNLSVERTPINERLHDYFNKDSLRYNIFKRVTLEKNETIQVFDLIRKLGYTNAKIYPGYRGVVKEVLDRKLYKNKRY